MQFLQEIKGLFIKKKRFEPFLSAWFLATTFLWPFNFTLAGLEINIGILAMLVVGLSYWVLRIGVSSKVYAAVFISSGLIFAHSVIAYLFGFCNGSYNKLFITFPIFLLLNIAAYTFGKKSKIEDWYSLYKISSIIIVMILFGLIFEYIIPELFDNQYKNHHTLRLSGWFREPSHLALSAIPSLILIFNSKKIAFKIFSILATLIFIIFSYSETLISLLLIYLLYFAYNKIRNKYIIIFILILIYIIFLVGFEYFGDELLFQKVGGIFSLQSMEAQMNLSSLVYLQGWQDAFANFYRSNGFGLGLNMMGCDPLPNTSARSIISNVYSGSLDGLNSADGSFLFSKIISEFGVFGLLLMLFSAIKSISYCKSNSPSFFVVIFSIFLVLFLSTFIRSGGYFSGAYFIMVTAFFTLNFIGRNR